MNQQYRAEDIYQLTVDFVEEGRPFAVAVVLNARGSTPQKTGAKALISPEGKIWGTLGGGAVEAEAVRRAVEACRSNIPVVFDFDMEGKDAADYRSLCGGAMRILIDPVVKKYGLGYTRAAQALQRREQGVLMTRLLHTDPPEISAQWFPKDGIDSNVGFPGPKAVLSCLAHETAELFAEEARQVPADAKQPGWVEVLVEPVIPRPILLIVGGGHVGQALALQAAMVGFDITVIDDRPEFTDPALFPEGVTTRCGDIADQVAAFPINQETYVVIVTRGHQHDAQALHACIHAPAAYIGMIGSRRKVALIRENFIEEGNATEAEFDRVFAPVGLDIGSVTVAEIAASIGAQLIAVRRKGRPYKPLGDRILL